MLSFALISYPFQTPQLNKNQTATLPQNASFPLQCFPLVFPGDTCLQANIQGGVLTCGCDPALSRGAIGYKTTASLFRGRLGCLQLAQPVHTHASSYLAICDYKKRDYSFCPSCSYCPLWRVGQLDRGSLWTAFSF